MIAVNGLEDSSISVSPFPPSLLPFFPTLTCFLSLSLRPCLSLSPTLLGFIVAAHHHGASLSPLMAQLLALMHFKHTAAATPQSVGSPRLHPASVLSFMQSCLIVLLYMSDLHPSPPPSSASQVKRAAYAKLQMRCPLGRYLT